jgi:hypothetical protein
MRFRLLIIFTVWSIHPSLGQDIEKILVVWQEGDEPPTKPRPPKYTMAFEINSDGNFVATDMRKDNRRRKLRENMTIEGPRVNKVEHWEDTKEANFTLQDLGIERGSLGLDTQKSNYQLNFPIPHEIILNVDSFTFCQKYKMTKSVSTGGPEIIVTTVRKSTPTTQVVSHSYHIGRSELNLKEYILCYTILSERIPDEFPHFDFFSKEKLAEVVFYYQKTVECEGYYYQEYADKNQLTDKERRMKEGWDFVRYMEQRVRQ